MRETIKKVFLATMLLSTFLFLGFPSIHLAHANENKTSAEATAKEKAEKEAKEKAEKEAKEKAENMGDVAEPPSGPNVNRETEEEEIEIETPASVTGKKVDGTGTVTDFSTTGSKAFYTITDSDQNVFYLIIDLDKTDNNVYFLSDISKSELSGGTTETEEVSHVQPTTEIDSAQAEAPKEEEGGNGFLIAVLLLSVVGVAAYYFLVMKKKQGKNNEEDDDEMSEDYDDDFYDEQVGKENQ